MTTDDEEYELKGPNAEGRGIFTDKGFLVKAGSLARREIVPSGKNVSSVHQRLIAEGVLEEHGGQMRFTKDHLFNSPSGAAAAVLGRTANGWISWKRANGRTLSEVKRVSRDALVPMLNDAKRQEIIARHQQLVNEGKLPTQQQLDKQYALFREHFGPSVLAGLDGEPLPNPDARPQRTRIASCTGWSSRTTRSSTTRSFGSIAGGSALKFRIFRRKETGNWQAGGEKGNQPKDITKEEAIEFARSHRDQLLKGIELLDGLPDNATDDDYAQLQDQMDEVAPDVSRLAWGHKYFSLLFPNKLDDYHSPDYQRFHLLKLLQLPPEGDGRYICAGRFVAAAKEVGLADQPFHNHSECGPRPTPSVLASWYNDRQRSSFWQMMRDRSCVAVGWPKVGDISWVEAKKESREKLKKLLAEVYPNHSSAIGRDCSQLAQFVVGITEGDIVLAADGMSILGIGRVVGGYEYHSEFEFPHQRQVEWLSLR